MDERKLTPGRDYAFRPGVSEQIVRVRLIEVREDGDVEVVRKSDGVALTVPSDRLVALWRRRRRYLTDVAASSDLKTLDGDRVTPDERQAAWLVYCAVGHELVFPRDDTKISERDSRELINAAGLAVSPLALHGAAFRDSAGWIHLPASALVALSRAIARNSRSQVMEWLAKRENLCLARERSGFTDEAELESEFTAISLVRYWAGPERSVSELGRENARLRTAIATAAEELEKAGRRRTAIALRSALE